MTIINENNYNKFIIIFSDKVKLWIPYIVFSLQLISLDLIIRAFDKTEIIYPLFFWLPFVFTFSFIALFVGLVAFLKNMPKKIVYVLIVVFFSALVITHITFYTQTSFAFSFQNMAMAGDGSSYILDSLISVFMDRPLPFILIFVILGLIPFVLHMFEHQKDFILLPLIVGIVLFVVLNSICMYDCEMLLPSQNKNSITTTYASRYKDVFNKFDERYSCIKIGGLYEYTLRDLVNPSQRIDKNITDEEKAFMDERYSEDLNSVNTHTGIFKDKNVIFLQLEGMDSWLLNEKDTPNLYLLKNNSIDFTNHYSNATGGGSTINNEMAVNTGYYMPLGAVNNMIFLLDNNFKTTLAKSFKKHSYSCNMFHMNKGVFYSRHASSRHLGYENYYGLQDKIEYSPELELDSYLIENEDFYEKMFKSNQRFMHYLITYTPHAPFTYKGKGQILFDKKYGSNNTELLQGFRNVDFAKLDVQETDKMVGELIQALKDNNLYDDTVIVAFADHCQYGMKDTEVERNKYGDVVDLGNQTPFFIWSSNCIPEKVNKINMQIDIMPTVLNMFSIPFYKDTIIGHDVFDSNYPGFAFFQDKSFYDGEYYYKNDEVYYVDPNTRKAQLSTYRNVNLEKYVNDLISKNDIALLHDYIR